MTTLYSKIFCKVQIDSCLLIFTERFCLLFTKRVFDGYGEVLFSVNDEGLVSTERFLVLTKRLCSLLTERVCLVFTKNFF